MHRAVCSTRESGGRRKTHLVVSATSGRDPVGVVSHLPDEHRVSLVGDKVLEALEVRLQDGPELLRLGLPPAQLEEADAFDVVEERVAVLRQFVAGVRFLRRARGRVVRGQELDGLVDDLPRDEARDEHHLVVAPGLSHEARERYLSVLALPGALRVLVWIEFDGDGVLGAEEEQLGFGF